MSTFRDAIREALAADFNEHKRPPWDKFQALPEDMTSYAGAILAMPEMQALRVALARLRIGGPPCRNDGSCTWCALPAAVREWVKS